MESKKRRRRLVRSKRYPWLGTFSLFLGGAFLMMTAIATVAMVRIAFFSFFLVLGAIDLALYFLFKER